ncbi:MAG TPA: transketolase [Candidatus Babeliales bacterium]|nr:transketolase [Candidatus Babeliales bacterium]
MGAPDTKKLFLEYKAYNMRLSSLIMTTKAGSGHVTSCLSAADIVAALFFDAMQYDPRDPDNPDNDRFILSKGHAAPILYAAWKEAGVLTEHDLLSYRRFDSELEGHPTRRFKYTESATGSLGIGLSIGAGMALAAKMDARNYRTFVLMGDAEIAEGSIWEAVELAAHYKLNNLIGIVDCNRLGQSDESLHGHHVQRFADKFKAFGCQTYSIDGHDMQEIIGTLHRALAHADQSDQPVIILAKTFKGHGVQLFENKENFHGKALDEQQLAVAVTQLAHTFPAAAQYKNDEYVWAPQLPQVIKKTVPAGCVGVDFHDPVYALGDMVATRKAYGDAVTALGRVCEQVICLDAEVKNSTFAEIFEHRFPKRFIQCFVAEQNMVSMGVGLERRGKMPFISTFSVFFSRAYDQIRMAAISNANLRLVGSHAGISIGQDGPSQMGLEDIALMAALPGSVVLYPSDAISTHVLVGAMAEYNQGISYLRTTRMETPVLYPTYEDFYIGGCKVVRQSDQDAACVVAAGVTLHQALAAYDQLLREGISIAVIDLYSIKPLDYKTVLSVAQKSGNRLITVEDHYLQGGMGQLVTYALRNSGITVDCLAVTALPRSGLPEELLAWAGIDAAGIMRAVKKKK